MCLGSSTLKGLHWTRLTVPSLPLKTRGSEGRGPAGPVTPARGRKAAGIRGEQCGPHDGTATGTLAQASDFRTYRSDLLDSSQMGCSGVSGASRVSGLASGCPCGGQ